jgi:hypothetical protein
MRRIKATRVRADSLQFGDLFSTLPVEHWDGLLPSLGERIWIRNNGPVPEDELAMEVTKLDVTDEQLGELQAQRDRTSSDRLLVEKLLYCLEQIVDPTFQVDDRVAGYLLPVRPKLQRNVYVDNWTKADDHNVYSGVVVSGEPPPRKGSKIGRWHPSGVPLGTVWFAWPVPPDHDALAYKIAEWLLILLGRQTADYQIGLGPALAGIPTG